MKTLFLILFLVISSSAFSQQFTQTVVALTGVVKDSENKPVSGWVIVTDESGATINKTRCNGKYYLTSLKPGNTYQVTIDAKGFFQNTYELIVPNTDKYAELSKDFEMKEMQAGSKLVFKVIPFDVRHAHLRPGSELFLEDYLKILRSNPRAKFTIEVYPESEGGSDIVTKRAEELVKYFQENKVRSEIVIDPKSSFDPQNPPPKGKQAKGKRYKGSIYLVVNSI